MTTLTTKTVIAAAGFAMASMLMAAQADDANAMPGIKLSVPTVDAGLVVKAGWRRRAVRRTIRRTVRRNLRHHRRYVYRSGRNCHFHWVSTRYGGARKVWHCGPHY